MVLEQASKLFKILSDESRLRIIKELLNKGEQCACKLLELVSCGQPTLSHHMAILVNANMVHARKEGKWVHYSCNKDIINELLMFIVDEE